MGLIAPFKNVLSRRKDTEETGERQDIRQRAKGVRTSALGNKMPGNAGNPVFRTNTIAAASSVKNSPAPVEMQKAPEGQPAENAPQPPSPSANTSSATAPESKTEAPKPDSSAPDLQPQPEKSADPAVDDLMSLFTEETAENLELKTLVDGLSEVSVEDLLTDMRDLAGQMKERWR